MRDLVDPSRRHTDIPSQTALGQAWRLEKIRREDFAWMNGIQLSSGHATPSSDMLVIFDDLNLVGIAISPAKADAPLLVHTNTVLAGSTASELLQLITRRHAEVAELLGRVYRREFAQHRALQIRRISSDRLASELSLAIPIREDVDHGEH